MISEQYKHIYAEEAIPYFDHDDKSLMNTIKNSSARRRMGRLHFIFRKVKNIILFRLSYLCPLNSWRVRFNKWRGVHIGEHVYIGQFCILDNAYPEYVYIEDNVSLAGENTILAHSNPYPHFENVVESKVAPVLIKHGAWIGSKSIILMGAEIGVNAIVSAGSVVDKNVPDYSVVKGNPMKIVGEFKRFM